MDIPSLLAPYYPVASEQAEEIRAYLDLLLKWNARMNLTALRAPEQIITRHFGESLFLAGQIPADIRDVTDIGSGAGFPGIPLKIARPGLTVTLIEAQQRKATFLREVTRALNLDLQVINKRAEDVIKDRAASASLVTLRAVEKFDSVLPIAADLVRPSGLLAILIGKAQISRAKELLPKWQFQPEIPLPISENRVILMGNPDGK